MCLLQYNAVRPHATLQMLGSHYLTDLRDAVGCVSDLHVFGELSNTPDMAPDFVSKVVTHAQTHTDTQTHTDRIWPPLAN